MGSEASCDVEEVTNISEETVSEWIFDPVDTVIITVGVPIVLGLGLLTNLSLLFVFLRVSRLRSETDVYLAHLALSDVLFLIMFSVHDIARLAFSQVSRHEPFGTTAECVLFCLSTNTVFGASVALITTVSLERYLALCHPIQHLKMRSRRRTYKMVAICWGIGVVFAGLITPNFAKRIVECLRWPEDDKYIEFPSQITHCVYIVQWTEYIAKPLLNIPWCIAMVGNIYMYIRIIHMLNKRQGADADGKSAKGNAKARQIRNQVAKMLVVNGAVFFLSQAPFALVNLTGWIGSFFGDVGNPIIVVLGRYAEWIIHGALRINTIVNPLIYCAFNAQYRAAFTEAFGCNRRPRQQLTNSVPAVSASRSNNQSSAQSVDTSESRL